MCIVHKPSECLVIQVDVSDSPTGRLGAPAVRRRAPRFPLQARHHDSPADGLDALLFRTQALFADSLAGRHEEGCGRLAVFDAGIAQWRRLCKRVAADLRSIHKSAAL